MREPSAGPSRLAAAAAAALALGVFGQGLWLAERESLTWDEPGYIAAGYANLRFGDYRLNADHPPLMQKLTALPLLFLPVRAPDPGAERFLAAPNPRASYGREFFFASGNDVRRLTRWARAPVLLLAAALVLCVFAWGRRLFGEGPALLAATLTALCPNLVAHGRLATEDLGCTTLMFASVWTLWRTLEAPTRRRALVCGLVTGLALLSKYTALLLAPIAALLLAASWRERGDRRTLRALGIAAGVAFAVVGFGYGLLPRPDRYLAGIFRIYPDVDESYAFYFWGHVSRSPRWYYGLASFALKTPLPTLALIALAGARALRSGDARERCLFLLLPPLVVFAASGFDATNPGVRRVLPAVPFLLLFAAQAVHRAPRPVVALAGALLLGSGLAAVRAHPHHLSYLNAIAGGAQRGPYVLDESNVDWGQDLPALAAWQREHQRPDETLSLYYFGSAEPAAYGVRATRFDLEQVEAPPPGLYAISAHYLAYFRKLALLAGADSDWLSRYRPLDRAGAIWIYRIGESPPSPAGSAAAPAAAAPSPGTPSSR